MVGNSGRRQRPDNGLLCICLVGLLATSSGCGMVATSHNMQGVRQYQQGRLYGAMDKFHQAMAANPQDANAYYNLAATLHRMGSTNKEPQTLQQAEQLYNECLNRNPNHTDCYRALAVLLVETDRSDRAFVLLKNWALHQPQSADARIELARLYQEFGDTKTAELQLQQALQLDQTNQRVWKAMAALQEGKGDYQQALANYQRAYALNGYDPVIAGRIAALNRSIGSVPTTPSDGTRTVSAPPPTARY